MAEKHAVARSELRISESIIIGKSFTLDMHAKIAYTVCMKQYTIRGIPEYLDQAARKKAQKTGNSLNSILVEALQYGLEVSEHPPQYTDMDDLAGTWVEDPDIDNALKEFDSIDPELWK